MAPRRTTKSAIFIWQRSSAGFGLWVLVLARTNPRRLKLAPLSQQSRPFLICHGNAIPPVQADGGLAAGPTPGARGRGDVYTPLNRGLPPLRAECPRRSPPFRGGNL